MRVIDIAVKDLRQILRDWKSALFMVVMPILFTVFFGLVFNPSSPDGEKADTRLPLGWINQDAGGLVSANLEKLVEQSDTLRIISLEEGDAQKIAAQVSKGELAAAVRIPAGYSQAILAGEPASLEVIADQGTAAGHTAVTSLETISTRLFSALESAQISLEMHLVQAAFSNETARQRFLEDTFTRSVTAWQTPPFSVVLQPATNAPSAEGQTIQVTGFTQSSAGMIVQFAVFGLINSAMILVLERKTRCLQRLLAAPIKRAEIIGGHLLAMFTLLLGQQLILILLGQFLFGVNYLRQPLAILLMAIALASWASSLGLLIGAVAKSEDQVVVLCLIAMFLFSRAGRRLVSPGCGGQSFFRHWASATFRLGDGWFSEYSDARLGIFFRVDAGRSAAGLHDRLLWIGAVVF